MSGHVLAETVRRPPPLGLRRPRLLEPLLRPDGPRLALVVAPPGCGKTTLLAQVGGSVDSGVGWYRVGPRDRSERALVQHVATALAGVLAGVLGSRDPGSVGECDDLLELLDAWQGDAALLVVDDLHEVVDTPAEQALGRLLDLGPPGLRVLLGSRRRPGLNLSRLQLAQELTELDADDLRFRSWEVERLFLQVYGEPLPPEAAAALTRRTEGWAAALQMFHLSTAGRSSAERRAAVGALGGRSRLIRSYLADNVLAEMTPSRRFFVTRTAPLGVLTGPLCDELLGTTGSHAVLRALEAAQLFTTSDDDGVTFHYHQVLQDHLEVVLWEELGQAQARAWFSRTGRVLERAGLAGEALRAHARAEDWASVSQLLTRAGAAVASGADHGYDVLLPAELRARDPWLALAEARRCLRRGAVAAAVEGFRRAEGLLDEPGFSEQCRRERALASAWLPLPAVPLARTLDLSTDARHWSDRVRAATVTLRQQRPVTPLPVPASLGDRLALGLADLLAGRVREAAEGLAAVADEAESGSVEQVVALAACGLLDLLVDPGDTERLEQAALASELGALPWLERLSRSALDPALHAEDDGGAGSWSRVTAQCRSDGDEWGAGLLDLFRGAVDVLAHDRDATPRLDGAGVCLRRLSAPALAVWADALRALQLARRGAPEAEQVGLRAEAEARSRGVPGARMVACTALAVTGRGRHADHRLRAGQLAAETGLPLPGEAEGPPACPPGAYPESPPQLRLALLGGFRLEVDGTPLGWAGVRPRALTLLRLLSLSADVDVHRERVVEALWPGVPLPTGTRRLQVAVSSLRQALDAAGLPGAVLLPRRGDAYRLALPPGARVDVRSVEDALGDWSAARARGDLPAAGQAARRCLAGYTGELLPEDGPADWVVGERDRLRLAVATAARVLAEDVAEGRAGLDALEGVAVARRSLELDPLQDRLWEVLAELHDRSGDPAAACRARREHARLTAELAAPRPGVPRRPLPRPRAGAPVVPRR